MFLGVVPGDVKAKPRILYLNYKKDSKGHEEWKWSNNKKYELLDEENLLPNLLSWSACLIDHSAIIFGGRNKNDFSNDVYKVQLRPSFEEAEHEIEHHATLLNSTIEKHCDIWQEEPKKRELIDKAIKNLPFLFEI